MKRSVLSVIVFLLIATSASAVAPQEVDSTDFSSRMAPRITRIGVSLVANAAITEVMKTSIHELRPNREDNQSMPSRHVSWMATIASIVSREMYHESAWWVLGAHALTDGMMLQRTLSRAHYPKDVLCGMAVGVASSQLGYFLSELVYPSTRCGLPYGAAEFMPSIDVTTTALLPLCGGAKGYSVGVGLSTAVRGTLPLSDEWGGRIGFEMGSLPMYHSDIYAGTLDGWGLSGGVVRYFELPWQRWSAEAQAMAGFMRHFHGEGIPHPRLSFTLDMRGTMRWSLTSALSIGVEAGYNYRALRRGMSSISVGIFTRATI